MEEPTISTKTITQAVLPAILKSPHAFLAYIGGGFYLVSLITPEQKNNIADFLITLDSLPGYLILFMVIVVLIYGLFLYPLGKFFGTSFVSLYADIQKHYREAEKHHDETRTLVRHIGDLTESVSKIVEQTYRVEGAMRDVAEKLS